MATMPNTFVIGAAKSGTTSLYDYLRQHPDVFMSPVKEPRYFAYAENPPEMVGPGDEETNRESGAVYTLDEYQALFAGGIRNPLSAKPRPCIATTCSGWTLCSTVPFPTGSLRTTTASLMTDNREEGRTAAPDPPLRVLGWPGFASENGNPYTRLLYEGMEAEANVKVDGFTMFEPLQRRYDVWHVHWPEDFLSYPSKGDAYFYVTAELLLFAWARLWGTRLVWTVHDLGPHESYHPWLEALFWPFFLPMVDGIISLSETAREEAYDRFPVLRSVPSAIVPHGHYRTAYPDPVPKAEARRRFDLDPEVPVALFVGRIRPYKNVEALIRAFRDWDRSKARLVVAGNPVSDALAGRIRASADGDARVRTDLRFIAEDDMPGLIATADLVVLPYETIMHSGSALLALSFDRPVLVPDRGAMTDLQQRVGTEWMRTYVDELTPSVLAEGMMWARTTDRAARAPVEDLDWPRMARQTVALYRRVLKAHD